MHACTCMLPHHSHCYFRAIVASLLVGSQTRFSYPLLLHKMTDGPFWFPRSDAYLAKWSRLFSREIRTVVMHIWPHGLSCSATCSNPHSLANIPYSWWINGCWQRSLWVWFGVERIKYQHSAIFNLHLHVLRLHVRMESWRVGMPHRQISEIIYSAQILRGSYATPTQPVIYQPWIH